MKKNQEGSFLFIGILGLHITIALHILLLFVTDISFGKSVASFMGMYPTWIVFFVIGLVKIRKGKSEILPSEE